MNRILFPLAALLGGLMPLVLDSALKGVALLAAATLVALMLWRASAAARHLVWLVAVVALLIVPLLSVALPQWRVLPKWAAVPALENSENGSTAPNAAYRPSDNPGVAAPAPTGTPELVQNIGEPAAASGSASASALAEELRVRSDVSPPGITWRDGFSLVWAGGFLLLVLRLIAAQLFLMLSTSSCSKLTMPTDERIAGIFDAVRNQLRIAQRVTLLLDERRTIPVVWGVFRPRLILPAEARGWNDAQLRSVLLHELAHIKRRDTLVQWLTQIACALHWWNPLVWIAAWRLHAERERACDDFVLASGVRASAYAEHLLRVATKLSPARWINACGLAMVRKSRLEGRLLAVLSEEPNRRGVTRALTAAALILGAGIAIPVAMLRAADETSQEPGGGMTLDAATEAQLDWGDPVNGLRGALIVRAPAEGKPPGIYLAVQNVSEEPLRFADTIEAEDLRRLIVSASGEILFALTNGEPSQTDVVLQPCELTYLSMMLAEDAVAEKSSAAALIEGIRKDSLQTWRAVLAIEKAPEGAWTGKLTTGETRGAVSEGGPQPKNPMAQALYKFWQSSARLNGDIPGGLISGLHEKVKEFIRNNESDASGGPYAKKMAPLEPRFRAAGDWKAVDVVALLDDVAAAHTIPLETTLEHLGRHTLQRGLPLPASLETADWGAPLESGLRMAYLLEPRAEAYHLGSEVKARIVLHNAGEQPVAFVTTGFQQPGHSARLVDGGELTLDSTFWTTLGSMEAYRLAPGEYCEIYTPGLGIGARNRDHDDWSNVRAGSWILCSEGDEVAFTPGAAMLYYDVEGEADADWWLEFITERLNREAPVPEDTKEREYLLYRVVRDLYGSAPSTTEGDAFAADKSPDALKNLAALLTKHPYGKQSHGLIRAGTTSFRVLAPDVEAAERPRVASNPGWFTLRDDVRFSVTRRPAGERMVNEASIIYFQQGKDNVIHKVPLPDGYNTWAAGLKKGETVLWVAEKGALRQYDFADPLKIEETRYEGDESIEAPIPADVREALRGVLDAAETPKATPQKPATPAAD